MRFSIRTANLGNEGSGCIVVGVYEGRKLSVPATELDTAAGGTLDDVVARDFAGELGTTLLLHNVGKLAAERVLLVGLGPEKEFVESSYRTAICSAVTTLRTTSAADATICLVDLEVHGRDAAWKIEQAVIGVMETLYRFDKLKSKPPETK